MPNIMIVDDEEWIRESIRLKLERSALPIDAVYVCANGEEALALLERTPVDIAICDIRMSDIDGLTLCGILTLHHPNIQKIIVSGHSEFDYALKAIAEGVTAYLIKPIDNIGLYNAVATCIERLNKDMSEEIKQAGMREAVYEKSENITAWLEPKSIGKIMRLAVPGALYGICHIYVGEKACISLGNMLSIARGAASGFAFGEDMFFAKGEALEYTAFFCFPPQSEPSKSKTRLRDIAGAIIAELGKQNLYEATCGLELSAMPIAPAFRQAKINMRHRLLLPEERVIGTELTGPFREEYTPSRQLMVRIRHTLSRGNYRELSDALSHIAEEISGKKVALKSVEALYDSLVEPIKDVGDSFVAPIKPLWRHSSIADMLSTVKELYLSRINITFVQQENAKTYIANRVRDFINNHYDQDISLEQLAESYYITPAYLSMLFKNAFGIGFLDYLLSVRLENAKALLKLERYKIKTIAEMTGFNDQHYFSRVFKKLEGVSPREYIQIVAQEKQG